MFTCSPYAESATLRVVADRTNPPPESHPRWMVWVCHVQPLLLLPSSLWRVAAVLRLPVGWDEPMPWYAPLYVVALGVVSEGLAALVIGFVRPWGVVFPSWVPRIGGERVPPAAAIVPASAASILLTWMSAQFLFGGRSFGEAGEPQAPWMIALYAPILFWGPLLALATVGYCLRLRRLPQSWVSPRQPASTANS